MNERSKTFTIEARFTVVPEVLYPNLSLEANIILSEKKNVLVIPRNYLIDNQYVLKASGEKVKVKIGLMDFEKVEILSGIKANDQLILPEE
jgi:multidrug efflux pump subunit AcrA (membrane-fusion protein)